MARIKIQIDGFKCERCGHEWIPRFDNDPVLCPKCFSPYWNRPRKKPEEEIPTNPWGAE